MIRCPECETEVSADANFCPECGASMRDEIAATEGEIQATATAEPETSEETGIEGSVSESTPSTAAGTRHAQHDRRERRTTLLEGRFWIDALIGGVAGFVVAMMLVEVFFPMYFLGIVGGALLSGCLLGRGTGQGAKVGAVAGVLATVPFVALLVAVFVVGFGGFIAADPAAVELARERELLAALGILAVFVAFVAFVVNIIFGVIGGLVGGALVEE